MSRVGVMAAISLAACASSRPLHASDTLILSCPVCHGVGESAAHVPALYGRSAATLETLLREFRDGAREGTAMPRLAKALSDAEIRRLAEFYGESQP